MPLLDTLPVGTAGRGLRLGALSAFTSAVAQSVWRGNVPLSGIDLSDRIATSGARDLILMRRAACLAGVSTDTPARPKVGPTGPLGLSSSRLGSLSASASSAGGLAEGNWLLLSP